MKRISTTTLTIFLLTVSISIIVTEKTSSNSIIIEAGDDQVVDEGEVVQLNGTAFYRVSYPVWPVDLSGDGRYLAIGWDKNVTFFSTASNIPLWTHNTGGQGKVGDLKLTEDGRYLVAGSSDNIYYYNTTSSTPLWSVNTGIRFDGDSGNKLDMTRDGKYVAAVATGNTVKVFDTTTPIPPTLYWDISFTAQAEVVRFSGDGNYLAMGGWDTKLTLGWIPKKSIIWSYDTGDVIYSSSVSYNGNKISTGEGNAHKVSLLSSGSNIPIWTYNLEGRQFEQVLSDGGNHLASANQKDHIGGTWSGFAFWNTNISTPIWTYTTGTEYGFNADAIDMNVKADYVVGGSLNHNVYLFSQFGDGLPGWSSSDGIPRFTYDTGGVINYNGISISYNGSYFAAGSWVGGVYLFSTVGSPHLVWTWFTDSLIPVTDPQNYKWDLNDHIDSDLDGNSTNDTDAIGPTPTHIFGDDGIYNVTLMVTNGMGSAAIDTLSVTVNNVAPTIEPFGPFTTQKGSPLNIEAIASDPGSDDLTFTWDWGDSTTNTITVHYNDGIGPDPYPSPLGTFPFSTNEIVQHTYGTSGIYYINLTVEDDDGGVAFYSTNVTVIDIAPPILYINISQNGQDVVLYWDPPPILGVDHYLIYRSTSQIDFDFSTVWVNTSKDNESGELCPIPLRTIWNDTKAALPDDNNPNYEQQYYYIIRAVNIFGEVSRTSRTVGKWTKEFPQGVSTFSLPLEPLETVNTTTDHYLKDMNAEYIKWMDPVNHIWMKHGDGGLNDTQMKVGEGFKIKFSNQTNYTFTGMPGAMISYDDDLGLLRFGPDSEAKNLKATAGPATGNVTLNWTQPSSMGIKDRYHVFRSTVRDGFWTGNYIQLANLSFDTLSYVDTSNATVGTQYYYMIVPVNETGVVGASTYSVGVWTEEYLDQCDTLGIPLKLSSCQTADWYCDNIPNSVGINYYNASAQRWMWHKTIMPEEAYDPILVMTDGYQISTSNVTKYTFIGV